MVVSRASVPEVLLEQTRRQPDAPAYTFIDYELDPAGYSETLTWSQVHRRVQVVAAELASCGSPGDRAAILAPQGLDFGESEVNLPAWERPRPWRPQGLTAQVEYHNVGNRVFHTAVLHERARQRPDVDTFDAEFFEISPITEIWSKGRFGV